ncbi:MAG: GNAT family N-acetyltransferase [Ramlibacter sp.]|nr:GNAT family N-acetyltransferase [Ramlibacter sp.]
MSTPPLPAPVQLREIEAGDLPLINRWRNEPAMVAMLGAGFRYVSSAVDEAWYAAYIASRANNVRLAILDPGGRMIGVVYLLHIDWTTRDAEFAIWIAETQSQGQSFGERATRLAIEHAFRDLCLERVHLAVLEHNERAIALYRKVGFVDEGTLRRAAFKEGHHCDVRLMGLLRGEYAGPA